MTDVVDKEIVRELAKGLKDGQCTVVDFEIESGERAVLKVCKSGDKLKGTIKIGNSEEKFEF